MSSELNYEYRMGIGTDIHRLIVDRELVLGGIKIPYHMGLLGHSDGDAVLHAVMDAMLGATAMGDIGELFPDTEEVWKDADSRDLVRVVKEKLEDEKWEVVNVDVVIKAEEPKLGPYKKQMKRYIASLLGIDFNNVNVKAKTNEGLGDIGKGQAIATLVTTLLRRRIKRTL